MPVEVLVEILNATPVNENPRKHAAVCKDWNTASLCVRNWKINERPSLFGNWLDELLWEKSECHSLLCHHVHRYSLKLMGDVVYIRSCSEVPIKVSMIQKAVSEIGHAVWNRNMDTELPLLEITIHPGKLRSESYAPGTTLLAYMPPGGVAGPTKPRLSALL